MNVSILMRTLRCGSMALLLLFAAHGVAVADDTDGTAASQDDEPEQVLVTGEQPGPGLWKVSKGDHVLWILGALSPVPKRMSWRSAEVERVIAESQQVLGSVRIKWDIGFFRGLFLMPSLLGARKNPQGQTLKDVLPPDVHARWLVLKRKYIGEDRGLERFRPVFAAYKLYSTAIDRVGMSWKDPIWPSVEKLAKRKKIPLVFPALELPTDKAKQALKEFSKQSLDDVECLSQTMGRLESDLDALQQRANAWPVGDIAALRSMSIHEPGPACLNAVMSATILEKYGLKDLPQRIADLWIENAASALEKNTSTFAVLPIAQLLDPHGWTERLRANGYVVEEPN